MRRGCSRRSRSSPRQTPRSAGTRRQSSQAYSVVAPGPPFAWLAGRLHGLLRSACDDIIKARHGVRLGPQSNPPRVEGAVLVVDDPLAIVANTDLLPAYLDRQLVPYPVRYRSIRAG